MIRALQTWARRLHGDEAGNVIVVGVASALLLAALMWALIGMGQRVVQKEALQSSADAAAFSAAVIKAKGLNIIAFCNLVLALLFAVLMLLHLTRYLLIGLAAALTVACFVPGGQAACGPAELVEQAAVQFVNWQQNAETAVRRVMGGLASAERAVNRIVPTLALIEAYHVGSDGAYQRAAGGALLAVTWPLPTSGLPVQEGTCKELARAAVKSSDQVTQAVVEKLLAALAIPSSVASFIGDIAGGLVAGLLTPLKGILCGGSVTQTVEQTFLHASCAECRKGATESLWSGNRVFRNQDLDTDERCSGSGGSLCRMEPGSCTMQGMPDWNCPGPERRFHACDSDSEGRRWTELKFERCYTKRETPVEVTTSDDAPKPLVLTEDWREHRFTSAFTVLGDAQGARRRRAAGMAAKGQRSSTGASPLLATAQAELVPWNGHEDLFHMDWRARLVPFRLDKLGPLERDANGDGVPGGATDAVAELVRSLLGDGAITSLLDRFTVH